MNYYAYVRDDERDDCDYPCRLCSRFENGLCNLLEMKVDEDDVACEYFEKIGRASGRERV